MLKLDSYEFVGVIVPGVIVTYGFGLMFPELGLFVAAQKVSFGELGLMLVLAFVAGQLTQAFGNIIETLWWTGRGWPRDWVLKQHGHILAGSQYEQFFAKITSTLRLPHFEATKTTSRDWAAINRQIYAAVSNAGRTARVDLFNGNYGMFRGIVAATVVVAIAGAVSHRIPDYRIYLGLGFILLLALTRMHRFAVYYARELYVQFLELEPKVLAV
jgi:hypothetical protein